MCDILSELAAHVPSANRRSILKAFAATASASGLAMAPAPAVAGESSSTAARVRTRLVLLGTSGGPRIGKHRAGISTAVVYGDRVYLIDMGVGCMTRLVQAGLSTWGTPNGGLANVRGIFFTHMHSDHMAEWPMLYAIGPADAFGRTRPPIEVFGPGDRGTLARVNPPTRPAPPVVNPANPTPGLVGMTAYLRQAWSNDLNDRMRDSTFTDPETLFKVQDVDLGDAWEVDEAGKPPRLLSPLRIWRDGDVTITATLVDHHPTAPAFAYRFDTPDGSIVVSGDCTVSPNLVDLAQGCDYLVHEVIDPAWVDKLVASMPEATREAAKAHLLEAHTTIQQVGAEVAEPANAKHLVLTHLAGDDNSPWQHARRGYSGKMSVGNDLMQFGLGRR